MVSRASFRRRSLRSALVADVDATPPPPNFDPALFCRRNGQQQPVIIFDDTDLIVHGEKEVFLL